MMDKKQTKRLFIIIAIFLSGYLILIFNFGFFTFLLSLIEEFQKKSPQEPIYVFYINESRRFDSSVEERLSENFEFNITQMPPNPSVLFYDNLTVDFFNPHNSLVKNCEIKEKNTTVEKIKVQFRCIYKKVKCNGYPIAKCEVFE